MKWADSSARVRAARISSRSDDADRGVAVGSKPSWPRPLAGEHPLHSLFSKQQRALAYLSERGVNLSGEEQTKTRTALEYFSSQIAG
jgi:hypothetical protein